MPPDGHVIFSAHGVPKSVPAEAERRQLIYFDATCPLVSKVHREAERHFASGGPEQRHILMIGTPDILRWSARGPVAARRRDVGAELGRGPGRPARQSEASAYITQTTLSVDDTAEIVAVLGARFPDIQGPRREDICYATTNRQAAVKAIAPECDLVIVIGSPNSSNSLRLREVAERAGRGAPSCCPRRIC